MKQLLGHYDSTSGDFTGITKEVTAASPAVRNRTTYLDVLSQTKILWAHRVSFHFTVSGPTPESVAWWGFTMNSLLKITGIVQSTCTFWPLKCGLTVAWRIKVRWFKSFKLVGKMWWRKPPALPHDILVPWASILLPLKMYLMAVMSHLLEEIVRSPVDLMEGGVHARSAESHLKVKYEGTVLWGTQFCSVTLFHVCRSDTSQLALALPLMH